MKLSKINKTLVILLSLLAFLYTINYWDDNFEMEGCHATCGGPHRRGFPGYCGGCRSPPPPRPPPPPPPPPPDSDPNDRAIGITYKSQAYRG